MSSLDDAVGNNSPNPSSLFFSLSSYNRFHSQDPNQSMSGNKPEHGSNSSKPSNFFLNLSSYNRFRRLESFQTSSSSSSSDSIPYSRTSSFSDPIPYSLSEIISALKNSFFVRPSRSPGPPLYCRNGKLAIPCCSFKRCALRNEKVVIFCSHDYSGVDLSPSHLSTLTSRSHHPSLVKLLGACKSQDPDHIYMVYEDIPGATLMECLQNPTTPLSDWMWRMQVALDLALGLEYIHSDCGMVHHMIKSSTVIVTEPGSNASICLFGAENFRHGQIKGTIGNMAPEALTDKIISQKSDVYAFGIVILQLISGRCNYSIYYLVEKARIFFRQEGEPEDEEIGRGRVMQFVDPRLHDSSFPVETAEGLIRVALQCVEDESHLRPQMASVAEDIRRLFLDSKILQREAMKSPTTAFSLSSLLRGKNKEGVPPEGKLIHYPKLKY